MSKLLQRLSDASKSGVYRAARCDEILEATAGSALNVARIRLEGVSGKEALMQRIEQALQSKAGGHVLLIEGAEGLPGDERGTLVDILASAASSRAGRGHSFFAVFLDGAPTLPELYRSRT